MEELERDRLPRHLAVIMDGNGRWATARGKKRLEGHRAGAESVRVITRECRRLGLSHLTLYTFSEENWQRPKDEVEGLMKLLNRFLKGELKEMQDNGIRLRALGNLDKLPPKSLKLLMETMNKTSGNKEMVLSLALSYGGRPELVEAARSLARDVSAGEIGPDDIDEAALVEKLYTREMPDPDLLIRTGGERRISNFLLWQIAYSEIYFTSVYWPDFRKEELHAALLDYQKRQRRFGKTGDQVVEENNRAGKGKR